MSVFKFKQFNLQQSKNVFPVGTDAMILGAYTSKCKNTPKNILDIGCGSGVLSLILITTHKNARITSIDINQSAIQLTEENFITNNINRNQFKTHTNSFLALDFDEKFDLIVCNPPFFTNDLKSKTVFNNLAKHDDSLPLELLFEKVKELMHSDSSFWFIYPNDERKDVIQIAKNNSLNPTKVINVFGKPGKKVRVIYQLKKNEPEKIIQENLIIRGINGRYTEEYIDLTKNLHGKAIV